MKITIAVALLMLPLVALAADRPPTISGTPPSAVKVGERYSFTPTIKDPDTSAAKLSRVVTGKPSWMTFDYGTGRLSGTPRPQHVGLYSNIVIYVRDAKTQVRLKAFSVSVLLPARGSATLTWTPPTRNVDGSSLANLAGYRVYYGTSPSTLNQLIEVKSAAMTSYIVDNLAPSTYYFVVRAVNAAGVESVNSNVAIKTIT